MSHFTVIVFGKDAIAQLAPYNENLAGCKNPKYDWYVLGGRWGGYFKAKDPSKMIIGETGIYGNEVKEGYGDAMKKSNIDIEGMKADYLSECEEEYNKIVGIINKWVEINTKNGIAPIPKSWNHYKLLVDNNIITMDEAKKLYNETETYMNELDKEGYFFWNTDPIEKYWEKTLEQYLSDVSLNFMVPYAFVINGEWYGRGEMGWFGISNNEQDPQIYAKKFWDTFNSVSDDTMIYLFDCHI